MDVASAPWWASAVFYQIYIRSFQDSTGDGVGDLWGAAERLAVLAELGVDAVWLSPIHPSPNCDFGYDVADYDAVSQAFGGDAALDHFLAAAHSLGLRVILDGVFNHTSDQHPWFVQSRQDRSNPRRDWYHWHTGVRPPNNWGSVFGGSAWTQDPTTGDWYLHSFAAQQPDLNWANPAVKQAIVECMGRWLDRGVAGFRLDVFNCYAKDLSRQDNPLRTDLVGRIGGLFYPFIGQVHAQDRDRPELYDVLADMRALADAKGDRVLIGETLDERFHYDHAAGYTGPGRLHLAFNFRLLHSPWSAERFHSAIDAWSRDQRGARWPTWVVGNHDFPRVATRWAAWTEDHTDDRMALVMLMQLTLRGPAFIYQGDELGLREASLRRSEIQDPPGRRFWPLYRGRDGCRTPMPWTTEGGFSSGTPWLPMPEDMDDRNVEDQRETAGSLWRTLRELTALRRREDALKHGVLTLLPRPDRDVLAWTRTTATDTLRVFANMGANTVVFASAGGQQTCFTVNGAVDTGTGLVLPPLSGIVLR